MTFASSGSEATDHQNSPRRAFASPARPSTTRLPRLNSDAGVPVSYTPDSSPGDSRIPRPKTSASHNNMNQNSPSRQNRPPRQSSALRQPLNLRSAFKLAQEQEAEDGTIDLNQAFNMASAEANRGVDASPSPAPRTYRSKRDLQDISSRNTPTNRRGNELKQQLEKFDRNHQLGRGSGPLTGLFGKNRAGPIANSTNHTLPKKASNGSLDSNSGARGPGRWKGTPARNKENRNPMDSTTPSSGSPNSYLGDHGASIPAIEFNSPSSEEHQSYLPRSSNPSPEKSLNWHLDADFTAGDLQVSDSPRIRTGKANGEPSPETLPDDPQDQGTPRFRRSNNKLEQIRERETRAASIPIREDSLSPNSRRNTKLDEIRAREKEALSKRAVATSRLDEIKARNSESRSESPEGERRSSRSSLGSDSMNSGHKPRSDLEGLARPVLSTQRSETSKGLSTDTVRPSDPKNDDPPSAQDNALPKETIETKDDHSSHDDSHELLRRLAQATSPPPPAAPVENPGLYTKETPEDPKPDSNGGGLFHATREERRARNLDFKSSRERPSVGFAGLKRVASSDSLQSKRNSKPGSEADPTDRIEAEMKLFAPQDNYSERGSVRAPSPIPPDMTEEETPRVTKIDPRTLPTPRVTGAYVETPATIRVKDEDDSSGKTASDSALHTSRSARRAHDIDSKARHTGSDESISAAESQTRSASAPGVRRRSICKRRRQPLINTAKPPSAKDDIRAILRRHEIDDSTLEDFDERLAKHEIDPEELKQMVEESTLKMEEDPENPQSADSSPELEPYSRMSKSLKTLLTDIRTAKQGIERLEDKVAHTEHKPPVAGEAGRPGLGIPPSPGSAAVQLALPALWRREPKFKFTPLGFLSLFLAAWWLLELGFSHFYATPLYCIPNVACDWSPHEPYYPYTMPFMIDEWVTGGKGRDWVWYVGEELGDYAAELTDWVTNADFTQRDQRFMDVWERKRHRRRLRKHGLVPEWVEPPGFKQMYAQWEASRRAREEVEEMEWDTESDESMSADESVRW